MKRFSFRLIVALATFLVGISLTGFWLIKQRSSPQVVHVQVSEPSGSLVEQPLSFRSRMSACGPDGSFQSYESSDGVALSWQSRIFHSASGARRELRRRLRGAAEIIERTPELDDEGRRVGERVVAVFAFDDSGQSRACVFSTYNNIFNGTEASSLRHVLAFEEQW